MTNPVKTIIPPIKSQGIKTKLVPWIRSVVPTTFQGVWIEPFMGTGVVGFNLAPQNALMCDTNPHLVNFYLAIQERRINAAIVREYLDDEGSSLLSKGEIHYYDVRTRFNQSHDPLDFLFLNRAGFNGMIRFNRKGAFNIPFCRKPNRFAKAYVTKITNQVHCISKLIEAKNFKFRCQSFQSTIAQANEDDIIYCDPPYIDRHTDYFNAWGDEDEKNLSDALGRTESNFILSTWHHNKFRANEYIDAIWSKYQIHQMEHFYHVGGHENNRNAMTEALVTNFQSTSNCLIVAKYEQMELAAIA